MRKMVLFFCFLFLTSFQALAGVGLSVGAGLPFLGQGGIDIKTSDSFSFYVGYNLLDLDVGTAGVKLSMPEALVRYHIFGESLFVGLGVGYQSFEATATDTLTAQTARAEVTGLTGVAKIGWMWGASDNQGFWFGVDVAYVVPLNSETTVSAPGVPTTSQEYIDVVDAADEYGETAYPSFTFARLGYIF